MEAMKLFDSSARGDLQQCSTFSIKLEPGNGDTDIGRRIMVVMKINVQFYTVKLKKSATLGNYVHVSMVKYLTSVTHHECLQQVPKALTHS